MTGIRSVVGYIEIHGSVNREAMSRSCLRIHARDTSVGKSARRSDRGFASENVHVAGMTVAMPVTMSRS